MPPRPPRNGKGLPPPTPSGPLNQCKIEHRLHIVKHWTQHMKFVAFFEMRLSKTTRSSETLICGWLLKKNMFFGIVPICVFSGRFWDVFIHPLAHSGTLSVPSRLNLGRLWRPFGLKKIPFRHPRAKHHQINICSAQPSQGYIFFGRFGILLGLWRQRHLESIRKPQCL